MGRRRRPIKEEERRGAKNGGSTKLSVVRGGHKIDLGRRSPWWSGGRMEPDTTIIAGASSWRGTFTQCGGIPRMMAGSMVVEAEQVTINKNEFAIQKGAAIITD